MASTPPAPAAPTAMETDITPPQAATNDKKKFSKERRAAIMVTLRAKKDEAANIQKACEELEHEMTQIAAMVPTITKRGFYDTVMNAVNDNLQKFEDQAAQLVKLNRELRDIMNELYGIPDGP